ncbi:MAG: DUF952 domain-containing protein [Anaerolineae bacterium]|jgi:uncharacterized protein (DUF952 family)|nr:DUF952 domain-containing protein [Anaerolineae bacterium]MBT7075184.1 DUF952 domain-containing protein [Anaerolineae bacterium]MBT7783909.1 DUF952 domain-containing protein [Anaerolineae bacterium]
MLIYHLTLHKDWKAAQEKGEYRTESLIKEGFIHCSTTEQVLSVANAFYKAQKGLVLLVIDPEKLTAPLQWEAPAHPVPEPAPKSLHGEFPHIYGALNIDAVIEAHEFEPNDDGYFTSEKMP